MKTVDNKDGFTIIEVVLVLAIAGLIFLMIFIALPALNRSQRDSARRDDMLVLLRKVKDYQTNNRGALPEGEGNSITRGSTSSSNWSGFYHDYLDDNFNDPNGNPYKLKVVNCGTGQAGTACSDQITDSTVFPNDNTIEIIKQANCNGQSAVLTTNPRKIAVQYKLEGGGVFCENT